MASGEGAPPRLRPIDPFWGGGEFMTRPKRKRPTAGADVRPGEDEAASSTLRARSPIRSILIVGGGSAGWMAAAAFINSFREGVSIALVESEEIGTVGVGEATIPAIRSFNRKLRLNEADFVRATGATFKLGIEFVDWGRKKHRYFHPFGRFGTEFDIVSMEQYWLKLRSEGSAPNLEDLSLAAMAASRGRFAPPAKQGLGATFDYAYHFDAGLYAAYLRQYSESRGVVRHEGRIVDVEQDPTSGLVRSIKLADGREVEADLFIDCSGFRALLIEGAMKSGFEDWSHWLPCDRALAVPTARVAGGMTPFTRSTAHEAGWQWRIPLQHRTGNGHVFVSALTSEDEAAKRLLDHVDGEPLTEPRLLKFKAGRRKPWVGNVVALGLAAGFLEPLESTSLYLVSSGILRLFSFFPTRDFDSQTIDRFNKESRIEWENARDFLVLHYHANEREDSELWRSCVSFDPPETLKERMDEFRSAGRLHYFPPEVFARQSWLAVQVGQFVEPLAYHPLVDARPHVNASEYLNRQSSRIRQLSESMPLHEHFIERHCRSDFAATA